ncbi:YczE/YyaS/YitT family protein [Alkalicoccus daliensis]|uniref:YitT family protein n=1 Tax=Alkalicoccus daliensis TaxID=745820 RepID=A0A1H0DWD1_9BACI|nr:membrane protein [Alkalicoccus daliensis]SDN74378.1 hypothetical protein SAMN04488053_103108 [Alkalicoccus daliensis]
MKRFYIISTFYLLGLISVSFGISLILLSELGAGPWDAFFVALQQNLGLTVGSWTFIIGFILILINGLLLKQRPDFSALITMFLIGSFLDFWLIFVFIDMELSLLTFRFLALFAGIFCIGAGVASYMQSNFARNPIDHSMIVFHTLTGKSLAFSKTFLEVSVLLIALIIGGPIGLGTVIIAFGIGPLIQFFHKRVTTFRVRLTG